VAGKYNSIREGKTMTNSLSFVALVNWSHFGRVLSSSITPVVAVVVTYIAVAQYLINRRQYRLALFEKRMAVFNSTMNMIAYVLQESNPEMPQCIQFMRDTGDHELLFGSEVGNFINEVYKKAMLLQTQIAVGPHTAAQQTQILEWFTKQMGEGRTIFLKYLDFRKP
jgi:hypothetical protein